MPCGVRNKNQLTRQKRLNGIPAAKPVRPRDPNAHGLLSYGNVSQHLVIDDTWTPSSIVEQYTHLNSLLVVRNIYNKFEKEANKKRIRDKAADLKEECRDGRIKLKKISVGNNAHEIRNILNNHRSMQRLYQKLPIDQVADNIDQSTFVLRKERDRLRSRLEQLKRKLFQLQVDRSDIENRIKYENEFVLEEEIKSRILQKKLDSSTVRFRAIKSINITYKKMVQVLTDDEIFYEPILSSLDNDILDQSKMIKFIIDLGLPVIDRFKQLKTEFHRLEERSQADFQSKIKLIGDLERRPTFVPLQPKDMRKTIYRSDHEHYLRETRSMMELKQESVNIEKVIKELKFHTLCAQAHDIYPSARSQARKNQKLRRQIEYEHMNREIMEEKQYSAGLLRSVLVHNLNEEEIKRLTYIETLRNQLKKERDIQKDALEYIQNRAKAFIMIRVCLWNLVEILRYIDRSPYSSRRRYRTSYLRLPLLKFEMYTMFSMAPPIFEEDIDNIMHLVKRKIYKLVKAYENVPLRDLNTKKFVDEYHKRYVESFQFFADSQRSIDESRMSFDHDKVDLSILSRRQIKAMSSKLIEEIRQSYN
uniref:Dbuz\CG14609e-PA n=1 Tax=Drosophila buzzatii TaxID=7264 RepID=Q4VIV6_DROBU|nr:Dbuz\CG14609e-PA [Drosophila buzzatii]